MDITSDAEKGTIRIAEDVVGVITGVAATQVAGVAGMSGGIAGGIAQLLGKNSLARGVKVDINKGEAEIDIFVVVNYGIRIPAVAFKIQEKVKKSVEELTGIKVKAANVHVQGIIVKKGQE